MKCAHPVTDGNGHTFPCGRCINCRVNRGQEWSLRLLHQLEVSKGGIFITLTYNDVNLPKNGSLVKRDFQLFMKRLRKVIPFKLKYYACGEYGDNTNRPHYHANIFGCDIGLYAKEIENVWGLGFVKVAKLNMMRINYTTSYINKKLYGEKGKEYYGDREAPFALMSKGLGLDWILDIVNEHEVLINMGIRRKGRITPIPRYYKKKMVSEIPIELLNDKSEEVSNELRNNIIREARLDINNIDDVMELSRIIGVQGKLKEMDLNAKDLLYKKGKI